jgi:hypothetical protein
MALDLITIASNLSECVCAALKAAEHPADVNGVENTWDGDCCIWPGGQVAYDTCCDFDTGKGGQAWVVLQGGSIAGKTSPCRLGSLLQTIEVGVLRCVGTTECGCDCKEQSALDVMIDFQAMLQAVLCCFYDAEEETCDIIDNIRWRFIGPEGGCAGSAITFTVQTDTPCCPVIEEVP